MCFRAYNPDPLRRFDDQSSPLPIRREPGLRFLRVYRIHGSGGGRGIQIGWCDSCGSDFQGFDPNRPNASRPDANWALPRAKPRRRAIAGTVTAGTEVNVSKQTPDILRPELRQLLDLTQRVGNDPLLTQASTGNSSAKLDGVLWIKASGRWMADAMCDDILLPLDLAEIVTRCLQQGVDPAERYPS